MTMDYTEELVLVKNVAIIPGNRKKPKVASLAELEKSIKERGLLHPITVHKVKKGVLELIAGERRLMCYERLGKTKIPARIFEGLTDAEVRELRLIENLQREDLTAWDEAEQVAELKRLSPGARLEDLADKVGRTPQWIAQRVAFNKLIPDLRQFIIDNDWPLSHIPLLARVPADRQPDVLLEIRAQQFDEDNQPTLRELAAFLDSMQTLMSAAPWKLTDADLVPAAGSCLLCSKRSAAEPLLFPEMADPKQDRCLDPACWDSKLQALIVLNTDKLKASGAKPIFVRSGPVAPEIVEALGGPELQDAYKLHECKKNDPDAQPAVIISGPEVGQTKYFKAYSASSNGATNGAASNGTHKRPVDQETGKPEELTVEERLAALRLKRLCKACELWSEKLEVLKPPFKGVVDGLLIWFGSWEKRDHRGDWDWNERANRKLQLNADGWAQLYPVFQNRLKRFGPMEQGEAIWKEATAQAKALEFTHVLKQCWEDACAEIVLTKVLLDQGVEDQREMPELEAAKS